MRYQLGMAIGHAGQHRVPIVVPSLPQVNRLPVTGIDDLENRATNIATTSGSLQPDVIMGDEAEDEDMEGENTDEEDPEDDIAKVILVDEVDEIEVEMYGY